MKTGVWEITMACNMRCGHCGSRCAERLPGELTTDEALGLCDELVELGLQRLTLSGGEPFVRQDWPQIAKRLSAQSVIVNAISNGWFVTEQLVEQAMEAGMVNIGMSLDGIEETHDRLRLPGAFARVIHALDVMQQRGYPSAIVTTIMQHNLAQLPQIHQHLEEHGVRDWQLQLGLPMGNLRREDVIQPEQVEEIVEFAEGLLGHSAVKPFLADSIGYFTTKLSRVSEAAWGQPGCWPGCQAGKSNIGILHDGSILGCTSIRQPRFIEGNIRQTSLREIWTRPGAFAWNRELSRKDLTGFCHICRYGEYCLGGCSDAKLTMTGDLSDNPYCAYRTSIERLFRKVDAMFDVDRLIERARKAESLEVYEVAERCLARALDLEPEHLTALKLWGYVWFKLGDFARCLEINQKAVSLAPDDAYIQKGLGISLAKCGCVEEGIHALQKAIALAAPDFTDPYHDLAVVLVENNRVQEAIAVLEQGRSRSAEFVARSEAFYQSCLQTRTM